MLEIKDLFVSYGMMEVLHGISLNVQTGELVSVIGPNGAGKTTLIKTIMGLVQPKSGAVLYDGQDISHIPPISARRWVLAMCRKDVMFLDG